MDAGGPSYGILHVFCSNIYRISGIRVRLHTGVIWDKYRPLLRSTRLSHCAAEVHAAEEFDRTGRFA